MIISLGENCRQYAKYTKAWIRFGLNALHSLKEKRDAHDREIVGFDGNEDKICGSEGVHSKERQCWRAVEEDVIKQILYGGELGPQYGGGIPLLHEFGLCARKLNA